MLANAWNGRVEPTEPRGTELLEAASTSRTNDLSSCPIASTPLSAAKPGHAGVKKSRELAVEPGELHLFSGGLRRRLRIVSPAGVELFVVPGVDDAVQRLRDALLA